MSEDLQQPPIRFAIIGCGYIFDRHLAAIESIGGKLVCALDIDPFKKNKMDSGVEFFTKMEDMDASDAFKEVDWIVIATPNYKHLPLIEHYSQLWKKIFF